MNHIDPDRDNFIAFKALPRDEPIQLLNLVRYRALASYPDGHEYHGQGMTGEQAFMEYFRTIAPFFERLGVRIIWRASAGLTLTGPKGQAWDLGFVADFPQANTFLTLVTDPEYRANVVVHRTAGVEDSRLVRFTPE